MPPAPNSRTILKCETVEPINGDSQESHIIKEPRKAGQIGQMQTIKAAIAKNEEQSRK